jgi:hypothetical protein
VVVSIYAGIFVVIGGTLVCFIVFIVGRLKGVY